MQWIPLVVGCFHDAQKYFKSGPVEVSFALINTHSHCLAIWQVWIEHFCINKIIMKKLLHIILVTCISFAAAAQTAPQQGVITYDMALNLREQVAKTNPAVAAMMPEAIHVTMQVFFKGNVFAINTKKDSSAKGNMQISTNGGDEKHIVDLKTNTDRTERIFNKRSYYTETVAAKKATIVYQAESKKIAGYTCNKAIVTTPDNKTVTVWYTAAIPFPYSPLGTAFNGLKGAVLQFTADGQTFTATNVDPKAFTATSLVPDPKAKKITEEQMQDLMEDAADNAVPQAPAQKGKQQTSIIKIKI